MKIILSLLVFLSACNSGPKKDPVSFKDFESLQGNWSGIQFVLSNDDSTGSAYPTKLVVTLFKDSLELNITNIHADGHLEAEKGSLSISEDDNKLFLGASEYDIQHVIRTNDELTIIAFKEDEDNDKPAGIRFTMIIRPGKLIMHREVKYKGTEEYFTRINLELRRKIGA